MITAKAAPIRVLVADDSTTARELLVAILQGAEGLQVVGVAGDGVEALRLTQRMQPDLVLMDIRMPNLDGLEATRRIMHEVPTPIVLVTGATMHTEMELSFEALQAGALTVVEKPGLADPETSAQLIRTVRSMAQVPVVRRWRQAGASASSCKSEPEPRAPETPSARPRPLALPAELLRRRRVVGIAASTGGPGALARLLKPLKRDFPLPVLVVQHVTAGFAAGFADWLNGQTALEVKLASHGAEIQGGVVLLAPDGYHLQVNGAGWVELYRGEPYKGLRPSANYLFDSLARHYGPQAVGIVLTGMGDDGVEGLAALRRMGGLTLAQDEQSSIVYGMPREAVEQGAASVACSLEQLALTLQQVADGIQERGGVVKYE